MGQFEHEQTPKGGCLLVNIVSLNWDIRDQKAMTLITSPSPYYRPRGGPMGPGILSPQAALITIT